MTLQSISSVNILMDVTHTRDVRFSNSPPRDDNTAFLSISKWISTKNQQHTQLKVMCYILDPFDLWDLRKYKFHSHRHTCICSFRASNNLDTTRHCTHTSFLPYKVREISLICYHTYFLTSCENIFLERNSLGSTLTIYISTLTSTTTFVATSLENNVVFPFSNIISYFTQENIYNQLEVI